MTAPLDFEFNLEPGYFTNLDRVAAISATRTSSRPQAQEADQQQPRERARQRWSWTAFAAGFADGAESGCRPWA
jgi:hypothetical protein